MDAVVAIQVPAGALYLLTVTVVACRLLLLARRSRELPELLLGAALLLGGTLGGPLEAVGIAGRAEIGPALAGKLLAIGKLFGTGALVCHVCFVWRVFRPRESWAPWLAGVLAACPLAGLLGSAAAGSFTSAEIPLAWFWVEQLGRVGASCWLVVEGARYYGVMKRRLQLGLADPMLTNRFLLWTLAGLASIALLLTAVPPVFLDPQRYEMLLFADLFVFSFAGVTVSVLYWLTFLPPAAYRRRFESAPDATRA